MSQSATDVRAAYVGREDSDAGADRDLAAATQRRMFRAQLIDRIGLESEDPQTAVRAAGGGTSQYGSVAETEFSHSY